jgi:hypothetical protein
VVTYPPDQVAAVRDPQARRILIERGLPEASITTFRPRQTLSEIDGSTVLVIGDHRDDVAQYCLDVISGEVLLANGYDQELSHVNANLAAFVDSLELVQNAYPFADDDADIATTRAAAAGLREQLAGVDPSAVSDPDGYWQTFIDDVAIGDYA